MGKMAAKLSIPTIMILGITCLQGNTIKEVVEHTMSNNPTIMSTMKNNEAYRYYIDEAKGGYYPKLDLTAYVGAKRTETNPDIGNDTKARTEGFNGQLDFEQLIYDGGLTSGQIDEAEFRYNSNKHLNQSIVDDVIYDSVNSYLSLVRYKNRLAVTENSLSIYNDYLVTAQETEKISGEALQKAQVNAKIHFAKNSLFEDINNKLGAVSSFKKNVGLEPDGKSCRPNLDDTKVPSTLKGLIESVLTQNPLILEQVENIKEQRAILNQRDAAFYPTLKFKAQAIYDDDLITEAEKTEIYNGRIELSYNLFNGNKDSAASAREKLFLDEAQKKLDTVTKEVVEEATNAYNSYTFAKKRVNELNMYIKDNEDILSIYKDQFEGGTRTFIDVINIERDLVNAKQDLVDVQYELDASYYQVFNQLGMMKQSVLDSNNDVCTETKKEMPAPVEKMEVKDDMAELQSVITEEPVMQTEEMVPGTYAVYFVAYKELEKTEKAIEGMREIIGDGYQMKVEPARGLQSGVIYNLETMEMARELRAKAATVYSDAYIRKIK